MFAAWNRWTTRQHEWWQTKKWPTRTRTVSGKLNDKSSLVVVAVSQVFLSVLSPGWKLNPVVGAVYGPELYAGKSRFLCFSLHLPLYASHRTRGRYQSQSDPWISTIRFILNLLNMKFPSNQSESESSSDKQWMIQASLSGWGSLSHCLRGVQL